MFGDNRGRAEDACGRPGLVSHLRQGRWEAAGTSDETPAGAPTQEGSEPVLTPRSGEWSSADSGRRTRWRRGKPGRRGRGRRPWMGGDQELLMELVGDTLSHRGFRSCSEGYLIDEAHLTSTAARGVGFAQIAVRRGEGWPKHWRMVGEGGMPAEGEEPRVTPSPGEAGAVRSKRCLLVPSHRDLLRNHRGELGRRLQQGAETPRRRIEFSSLTAGQDAAPAAGEVGAAAEPAGRWAAEI